jgi:hypothetical protein
MRPFDREAGRRLRWQPAGLFALLCLGGSASPAAEKMPPPLEASAREPVKYVGSETTDRRFYHGGLRHAVGVHTYQAYRANRAAPPEGGDVGWTYSHAPMLAYWKGRFYLQYLSNLKQEHTPPARTMLATSKDGRHWTTPQVLFPVYPLPEIRRGEWTIPAGTPSVMHQRMGFYVAPDGRLLTLAFYGFSPTPRIGPNTGQGLGRVVRQIHADGTLGPIYFIRYNRHAGWDERNTRYPFYKVSPDAGFVAACEALLADKLMTLQWWEDDRARDGFYATDPYTSDPDIEPKALSYFHRPDGVVVGLWKSAWSALSADEGRSWTPLVQSKTLWTNNAKIWAQHTEDGRYALVYNHSATRKNRFPVAVMTSDDGHAFDDLLCLHGEVSPIRYHGIHKNVGTQYFRGIVEGNGDPPGSQMWNTYSMNKEDIWVSRTRVPITASVKQAVSEDFESAGNEADLELWNLHVPQWAPISIAEDPLSATSNHALELRDEDPWEYALAERAFPEAGKVELSFRVLLRQIGHATLNVELQGPRSERALELRFDPDWLSLDLGSSDAKPIPIGLGRWLRLRLQVDAAAQSYDLSIDGEWVRRGVPFPARVDTFQRLVFRTGPWRGDVRGLILDREPATQGLYHEDLPGAGDKVPLSLFLVDDVEAAAMVSDTGRHSAE